MDNAPQSWQDSAQLGLAYSVAQFTAFLPRLLAAAAVVIFGIILARIVRRVVVRGFAALRVSHLVEHTPLEVFLKQADAGQKLEEIIGSIFYWLLVFVILSTAISMLGLTPLSQMLDTILGYIPHVFSAFLIFFFGVLLAGVVEHVVKNSFYALDRHSARLFAKLASYMVVTIVTLAALAELGIATQFMIILFTGVVFTFSLGTALALGLGGQEIVKKVLNDWYRRTTTPPQA